MHNDLIGSIEAASILNVDRATFNRWVARGDVPVEVKFPGATGARMFRRIDVERVAKDRGTTKDLAS
jgi:predicted site-specific integrase-resolvase